MTTVTVEYVVFFYATQWNICAVFENTQKSAKIVQFLPCTSLKLNCDVFRLLQEFLYENLKFSLRKTLFLWKPLLVVKREENTVVSITCTKQKERPIVTLNFYIVDKPTPR